METPGAANGGEKLITTSGGNMVLLGENIGKVGSQWLHLAFEFDFDYVDEDNPLKYKATVYYGESGAKIEKILSFSQSRAVSNFNIGFWWGYESSIGDWFGIDNLQVYRGVDTFANLPEGNYGTHVKADKPFDFDTGVTEDGSGVNINTAFNSALTMKLNVVRCLTFR